MTNLSDKLFAEIKNGLAKSWTDGRKPQVEQEVSEIKNLDKATQNTARYYKRQALEKSIKEDFERHWNETLISQITQKHEEFSQHIEKKLLARHPWLNKEKKLNETISLKDQFLFETLKILLLHQLEQKNSNATKWENVLVNDQTKFNWKPIDENGLQTQIQGYPLSNASFYNNRPLPSYLDDPFHQAPTRYDLYRLLKKTYPEKFTPQKLSNEVFCTKIAPLHHTELATLSSEEMNHLETIVVNIGEEESPEWVLLDKKENTWKIYAPQFLLEKWRNISALQQFQVTPVDHATNQGYFSADNDWHAVLLSRVLPWAQSDQKQNLEHYRSNIFIPALFQNTLESTCLPAQQKFVEAINKASAKRAPLSALGIENLYLNPPDDLKCLFTDIPETPASLVIQAFDADHIRYDPADDALTITHEDQYKEALKLAYYHGVKKLVINTDVHKSLNPWFANNLELTTIEMLSPKAGYQYPLACAARNRFLQIIKPHYLTGASDQMAARQSAWKNTGEFIYAFLKNDQSPAESQRKNIAEMGEEGLTVFFNYLDNILTESANLSCTLNLDSAKTLPVQAYIHFLTQKIQSYSKKPLFSALKLVLPTKFDEPMDAFKNLILALETRRELKEVYFDHPTALTPVFLEQLITFAKEKKLCLQIKIPEWDESPCTEGEKNTLKAKYRQLQNTILQNIRAKRTGELSTNTATIATPLPVAYPLKREHVIATDQKWDKNKRYTLASASLGIQQQTQQEVAQEVQQKAEAEQQSQPKTPVVREIKVYPWDEDKLITRHSLKDAQEIKKFSSWVGSDKDAAFVIQKMDAAAKQQIEKFSSLFSFGIDPDRTPGFRRWYSSTDKSFILTYDETLVERDIIDQELDPFAIQTNAIKPATSFCGDYRQLAPLDSNPKNELTLWHHLATETVPQAIQSWLQSNHSHSETSETIQYYNNVNQQIAHSADENGLISILKQWPGIKDDAFLSALFNKLTPENMRAFGQLFYHYDGQGNKQWLNLVHEIYEKFPEKFSIFKERLLDPLSDWSEVLEKSEVEALTASMQKLDGYPQYQEVLWNLIDKHGESVGRMRYAEVWRPYDAVITYMNAHHLKINEEEFGKVIAKYSPHFNATQFLRRLHTVLQKTGNRQDSQEIQQEILNHLSEIDWRESGLLLALEENYSFWDPLLKLENLASLQQKPTASYISTWDDIELNEITNPIGYTLRYAAQKLKLNKKNFDEFKTFLTTISKKCSNLGTQSALMRLITASIASGMDTIDELKSVDWKDFDPKGYQSKLDLLNQNLQLDSKELVSRSYHVRLNDLPILLEVLQEASLATLNLETINALGRALQSYPTNKKENLQKLVAYGKQHGFDAPLITAYPWLIDSPIENPPQSPECIKFYKQLSSIDFLKSSKLPDKQRLDGILKGIETKGNRHEAVKALREQECLISDQDAEFKPLEPSQKKMFEELYLSKTFQAQNRALLIKLCDRLAIKPEGNDNEKIATLLKQFSALDRKNYYDELGQLLGLLVEQSKNKYYSLEQLTIWLAAVFDENAFKTKPYPVEYIRALLTDAVQNKADSSLLNSDLHQLKTKENKLDPLKDVLGQINLSDLPAKAKKTLVKYAVKFKDSHDLKKSIHHLDKIFRPLEKSPSMTAILSVVITRQLEQEPEKLSANLDMFEKLTQPCLEKDLKKLWEKTQRKLLGELKAKRIDESKVKALVNVPDQFTRAILIEAFTSSDDLELIQRMTTALNRLSREDKGALAAYYCSEPKPTLGQLSTLLSLQKSLSEKIHHFETVVQTIDPVTNISKRHYGLDEKDAEGIYRILRDFKINKKTGIKNQEQAEVLRLLSTLNTYSNVMQLESKTDADLLQLIKLNRNIHTPEGNAHLFACMREMVLRKTGKWANHAQMFIALYGSLHNDDNLLHQIRTGEGKTLITLMRACYRALNGQMVDVFSSKESLPFRDHEASTAVLDALGIRHSYITANSNVEQYHTTVNEENIGAVHYATIANWSLFISDVRWGNKDAHARIKLDADNRVAYLDEADEILRNKTLFNFSAQAGASIYNFDAWVYQVAYEFYLAREERFKEQGLVVHAGDLEAFYSALQSAAQTIAPEKSSFFQKYLASGDDTLRDQKLVKLLNGAHLAKRLKKGVDFCVMDEEKKLSDGDTLDTRFAKVMINNQIYHGSTYIDVHQALHTRLNNEAIEAGETPNFFIEPESEVALSLNAAYVLKHYYTHIEACTGTAGNQKALKFYRDEYGIYRVTKTPPYQEIKTKFLPPIYASAPIDGPLTDKMHKPENLEIAPEGLKARGQAAQVEAIVQSILDNEDQPILITCKDYEELEILGNLIQNALQGKRNIVIDSQGGDEEDILKNAGLKGALTLSARLGRGSDIKPYDPKIGLKLIRTYPDVPDVVKQEQGRQGRNGAEGICQDIFNYTAIAQEVAGYMEINLFKELLEEERAHLEKKLNKHRTQDKEIWKVIKEDSELGEDSKHLKEKYLLTRTLQRYKYLIQEESRLADSKENLWIEGSMQVMAHSLQLTTLAEQEALETQWIVCRAAIEAHWNDNNSQLAKNILNDFYKNHGIEPLSVKKFSDPSWFHEDDKDDEEEDTKIDIPVLLDLHRKWLKKICESAFKPNAEVINALYGEECGALDALYQAFETLDSDKLKALTQLVDMYPCHIISCQAWCQAIDLLSRDEHFDSSMERLKAFFAKKPLAPTNVDVVHNLSKSFMAAVEGMPDIAFLQAIIDGTEELQKNKALLLNTVQNFSRSMVSLCNNYMYKEDIVFFLDILQKSSSPDKIINCSMSSEALKYPETIRPLISLISQHASPDSLLAKLTYDENTAVLLDFLSKRPHFDLNDYEALQSKINNIEPKNRKTFLQLLAEIPPYISVKEILKHLSNLPGKYSFEVGYQTLQNRIQRISTDTRAFNEFLFNHDIIKSCDSFDTPVAEYAFWEDIFSKLPLENRGKLFTSLKPLNHLTHGGLESLANAYVKNLSNQKLEENIQSLLQTKTSPATTNASSTTPVVSFFSSKR